MGLFSAFDDDHNEVHHKGSMTNDALAGAVAYQAVKAYENHLAENGQPDNHAKAKEILAGFAAAGVTQLISTKGLDAWDNHKRKKLEEEARERLNDAYDRHYQ